MIRKGPAQREAEVHLEQGRLLEVSGDLAGAMGAYRHAVAVHPEWSAPYLALAELHRERMEWDAVLDALARARELGDDAATTWRTIGRALALRQQWTGAAAALNAALARAPEMGEAWHMLAEVLRFQGRYHHAADAYRRAVGYGQSAALAGFVETLLDIGALDEAAERLHVLRAEAPGRQASWLTTRHAFLIGNFEVAWANFEARFHDGMPTLKLGVEIAAHSAPRWRGEDLTGRRIAVLSEQGNGDVIQFVRFARELAKRGADVSLVLDPTKRGLAPLLRGVDGVARVEVVPEFSEADFHVPLLSIPFHLGTGADSIPAEPYLRSPMGTLPPPLATRRGLRIGIVWAGDPTHFNDRNRSSTIESMLGLASVPNVDLFSLQVGPRRGEIAGHEALVTDLTRWIGDWGDTATMVQALDLVISVDTAVAHLAAALGRPVWMAVGAVSDCRWFLDREDSPWYPSLRLFRQKTPGLWEDVFARIHEALVAFAAERLS